MPDPLNNEHYAELHALWRHHGGVRPLSSPHTDLLIDCVRYQLVDVPGGQLRITTLGKFQVKHWRRFPAGSVVGGGNVGLTPWQRKCLGYIVHYWRESGGVSPAYREIASGLGINAISNAHRIVDRLIERGYINKPRSNSARCLIPTDAALTLIPTEDAA